MGKSYKYASYHTGFTNCPPATCSEKDCEAFRFVFDESTPEISFLPVLIVEEREAQPNSRPRKKVCKGYGLSFFSSEEKAQAKFISLQKTSPQIHKRYGSFIAKVEITKDHGTASE